MSQVPAMRVRSANAAPVQAERAFVLYWMNASRRTHWNFALDRAVEWCRELNRPLVVVEALTSGYPWASPRFHAFVLAGMADNAKRFASAPAAYYPYVEPDTGAGRGLIAALCAHACVVVTDDYPCFFLPSLVAKTARRIDVRLEVIDSNGLLPLRATDRTFSTAYALRRFLQAELPGHWHDTPRRDALRALPARRASVPRAILSRWPRATSALLRRDPTALAALPLDHSVEVIDGAGGAVAAQRVWRRFLKQRLSDYVEARNRPDADATSGLSPYLHFGHLSVHQVFNELARHEDWSPDRVASKAAGKRTGWWGMSPSAEAFLDQLITWRELGFNACQQRPNYDRFESLPDWARQTLEHHAEDPREAVYNLEQFESAQTHDALWNAAQMQLVREGVIHNYLRMLWGKMILAWSSTPWAALDVLIELNNKYALDGRDPNSYSGILWCFGLYDRPWGPEREVFGTVRYMTSKNTARKYDVRDYIRRHSVPA